MSRIGNKPIAVPANVKVGLKDRTITVQGPLGTLTLTHDPDVFVKWEESEKAVKVSIDPARMDDSALRARWGTTRANIQSMIVGVTQGYEENMEVVGVGWTAAVHGGKLKLVVGFANPILMEIPRTLNVTVDKTLVKIKGPDKQMVGQFAAEMRARRKPEPYNGKGIKYVAETIKRKQGKTFGA
jgi:large subunit ribosomal protein L6